MTSADRQILGWCIERQQIPVVDPEILSPVAARIYRLLVDYRDMAGAIGVADWLALVLANEWAHDERWRDIRAFADCWELVSLPQFAPAHESDLASAISGLVDARDRLAERVERARVDAEERERREIRAMYARDSIGAMFLTAVEGW